MDRLPPRLVRRTVIAPLVFVITVVALALSPLFLLGAAILDLFVPGSWRTLRVAAFITGYLALEMAAFVALFGLWVASGFGWRMRSESMQRAHYRFMRWWLARINGVVRKTFRLKIYVEDAPTPQPGPVLVFSRHAGPGNSLMLIGTLLIGYQRRPRIVMLAKLQWEPLFDCMLNRLPNRFIRHDPARRHVYLDAIGELARDMGDMDAFVLFPEGKDFTPRVRRRAIEYLRGKGHDVAAARAEAMAHVLPPRHNGVMTAMQNNPHADVVLVAHSVLEDVGSFKDLWRRIPLEHSIHARYWRIPQSEIPQDQDELIEWLYAWWERIDRWIEQRAQHAAEART